MRKLIFDPEPRQQFPFKDLVVNPEMQGKVRFPSSGKSMQEFVRGAFLEHKGAVGSAYFEGRQLIRSGLRDMLDSRRYHISESRLPDHLLSLGAGGIDFPNSLSAEGNVFRRGIVINTEFGNIEAPHVHILVDMLRRAVCSEAGSVLDLGCGPVVEQKINLKSLGLKKVIYADSSQKFVDGLGRDLSQKGRVDVQRKFLQIDKDNLTGKIDPGTVRAVIRAGVGMISGGEADGIRKVGTSNVELYVSNGIDGNPLGKFLEVAEDYFPDIEVYLGYQRYALLCRAA